MKRSRRAERTVGQHVTKLQKGIWKAGILLIIWGHHPSIPEIGRKIPKTVSITLTIMTWTLLSLKVAVYGTLAVVLYEDWEQITWLVPRVIATGDVHLIGGLLGLVSGATAPLIPYKNWKRLTKVIRDKFLS